jgi:hypothetical protein
MDLTIELNNLQSCMDRKDTEGFKTYLKTLYETSNPEEKEIISRFVEAKLKKSTRQVERTVNDIQVRMQIGDAIDILPLSYISKKYFNKTRQWLYQRINGSIVNNKKARFTESEIETFNFALQDISKQIGSTVIHS